LADEFARFLQSHLGIVVEYAERYGVNIPLGEETIEPEVTQNGAHQGAHDDLAALLHSATAGLAHDDGSRDMHVDNFIPEQHDSFSADDLGDLSKLIAQSLSNHHHEPASEEGSLDHSGQHADSSPFASGQDLASLISEKLTAELKTSADDTSGLPTSLYADGVHATNSGRCCRPRLTCS